MRFRFLSHRNRRCVDRGIARKLRACRAVAPHAGARPRAIPVDTELVLAVDVSYSMDPEEQQIQREGYIDAITSREFMSAIRAGSTARSR